MYHVKEELVYCGVDIAKLFLDVAIKNEKRRLANDATGHRQLIKWLKEVEGPVQVICEPSGGYERGLVQALVRGQIKVSLVQANRVPQFARASGILAKTDGIDARVLCAFGAAMRPPTLSASNLEQQQLRDLESQRRHLTGLLVMEQNRGARLGESAMRTLNRRLIKQIQRQIEKVDLLIKEHVEQSQELSHRGSESDFGWFTGTAQSEVKLAQDWIVPRRDYCAHVKSVAYRPTPTVDRAFAT